MSTTTEYKDDKPKATPRTPPVVGTNSARIITPDDFYRSQIDWHKIGRWNKKMYSAEQVMPLDTLTEEEQVAVAICKKYYYGTLLVQGHRGGGKSMFANWVLWHMKNYFGRKVGSDKMPSPEFGDCHLVTIDNIAEQLKLMDQAQVEDGDFRSANSWLRGMAVMCDEFYRLVDKRNTMSRENRMVNDIIFQIRHYEILLIGIAPDVDLLDAQRTQEYANAVATCIWMSNGEYSHVKVRPIELMTDRGVQRMGNNSIDHLYIPAYKWCNLYQTRNPMSGRPKLSI
jgi:hypothetical protein